MSDALQMTFGAYEKTEEDLISDALNMPLDVKIDKAIKTFKAYESQALQFSEEGFYVCDSYGKDSDCIVHLAKMAGVKHQCYHNRTTIDPPELIRFGRKNRKNTIEIKPKQHLILGRMVEITMPPLRQKRWCCAEYKEQGGKDRAKVIGVRAAESSRRAKRWKTFSKNKYGAGFFLCPIVYWTDKDVWDFHAMMNLEHCSLYDEGFKRLGCIGCPMAGKGRRAQFDRWPGYEKLWKLGFKKLWEKWEGVPTKFGNQRSFEKNGTWENHYRYWMEEQEEHDEDQCNFLDMMEQR